MTEKTVILYVEDNPENRLLIRRILEVEGYKVVEAENATKALAFIQENTPDLILMDINMPDVDGYTLTAQMKTYPHLYDVPIIALTANVMKGDRERTLAAGCDGYIHKPVDVDTLPEQVARYLKK
ncbi:MAG TPA: response regulator [Chloroflexi bacterium]|nr:response regulator [Chloroflexota bacterium]